MLARGKKSDTSENTVPGAALRTMLMSGLTLAPAAANVVMQLARLPIGHAVVESRVESGALSEHPLKRTRTTLGYLLVALYGDDEQREQVRREVNRQHQQVRSRDGDPVQYNAFDVELQLWVAACLYRGALDAVTLVYGPQLPSTLDELYVHCARFATTLQVPATRWPADRETFEDYWQSSLELVAMDETTRTYLRGVVSLDFLPRVLRVALGPAHEFITAGLLPEVFRRELGLAWSDDRQRRFNLAFRVASSAHRRLPRVAREFPLNWVWWDTQRRLRRGHPFV